MEEFDQSKYRFAIQNCQGFFILYLSIVNRIMSNVLINFLKEK